MKKLIRLVFLIAGLAGLAWLAGCKEKPESTTEKPVITTDLPESTMEEEILGVSMDYNKMEITVVVVSKGCTRINDLSLAVINGKITLKRNKKDECKAMPEPSSFTFSFRDAGIDPDKSYLIGNKLIANPNLANIR